MSATPNDATHEGRAAKAEGKSMDANPYRAGSQEGADWLAGFTDDEQDQNTDRSEPLEG